jgi:hypothetical protein
VISDRYNIDKEFPVFNCNAVLSADFIFYVARNPPSMGRVTPFIMEALLLRR